ncbi:MAG: GIY-YIG nuclease family protein [bacterium]|nr:GIY-YIG nuclease family protein [bacterium]
MRHQGQYFVYIITNYQRGILYVGVTSDIIRRVYEHKQGVIDGFTKKYHLDKLVYYEIFGSVRDAISREKIIKTWNRKWKIELIEKMNSNWDDLYETLNPL